MIHAPRKYHRPGAEQAQPAVPAPATPALNILGTWYITRSTNPIWSDKRNVAITLTLNADTNANTNTNTRNNDNLAEDTDAFLPLSALSGPDAIILANKMSYQTLGSDSIKITKGTDRAIHAPHSSPSSASASSGEEGIQGPIQMEWRGTGWLRMVRARWEILGWGEDWFVAYAEKSMFTSAGISLYSRGRTVMEGEWAGIEEEVKQLVERYPGEGELREMALGMRVVRQD